MSRFKFSRIVLLSFFYMVSVSVVQAPAEKKSANEYQLESVIVTAEKREEKVQNVAVSMDVFTGTQIEDANITDLGELIKFSPNLFTTPAVNINTIVIRGVSSINVALNPPAGLFVDDIS